MSKLVSFPVTLTSTSNSTKSKISLLPIVATAAQDPAGMAQKAVQVGNDILHNKKPELPTILIPVKLVTRDNEAATKAGNSQKFMNQGDS